MDRPFPYVETRATVGCTYLQQEEEHYRLAGQLENAIKITADGANRGGRGRISQVLTFLVETFGGPLEQYQYLARTTNDYLVMLPIGMNRSQVVNRGTNWGMIAQWDFNYWSMDDELYHLVNNFKVRINITDFPIMFWHPKHIAHVVSEFGELDSIDEQNIQGPDRKSLNLWVNVIDPRRIPTSKILPFGDRWAKCYINVVGWQYIGWVPPEARMTKDGPNGEIIHLTGDYDQARFTLKIAHDRIQFYLSNRSPASAGSGSQSDSMDMADHGWGCEPGLPRNVCQSPTVGGEPKEDRVLKRNAQNGSFTTFKETGEKGVLQVGDFFFLADRPLVEKGEILDKKGSTGVTQTERVTIKVGEVTIIHKNLLLTSLTWEKCGHVEVGINEMQLKVTYAKIEADQESIWT